MYAMYHTISHIIVDMVTDFKSDNQTIHVSSGFLHLAVYIVRVLISDVCRGLDTYSDPGRASRRSTLEQALHRRRRIPFISVANLKEMTERLKEGRPWPESFRIDVRDSLRNSSFSMAKHNQSLTYLQSFYPGCRSLNSAIKKPNQYKKMYRSLNEDGSLKFSDFISKLYTSSEYLDHFTDLLNRNGDNRDLTRNVQFQ